MSAVVEMPWTFSLNSSTFDAQRGVNHERTSIKDEQGVDEEVDAAARWVVNLPAWPCADGCAHRISAPAADSSATSICNRRLTAPFRAARVRAGVALHLMQR